MTAWIRTVIGGILSLIGNVVGGISSVYWTESTLSLYGMMLFQLLFLAILFILTNLSLGLYYRDFSLIYLHNKPSQRKFLCLGRSITFSMCRRKKQKSSSTGDNEVETVLLMSDDDDSEKDDPSSLRQKRSNTSPPPSSSSSSINNNNVSSSVPSSSLTTLPVPKLYLGDYFSNLSQVEFLCLAAVVNMVSAVTQFYATPPDRTPPILQAIFPCVSIAATIPFSKIILGDRKVYTAKEPIISIVLILAGVLISLIPSIINSNNSTTSTPNTESGTDTGAWSAIFLVSTVFTALAFIMQQAYLIRDGVLQPGSTVKQLQSTMLRYLVYNQFFVTFFLLVFWWIDILPWFGSTTGGVDEWSNGVDFSFSCSLGGPNFVNTDNADGDVCTPMSPIWAVIFLVSYTIYLIGIMLVNTDSAVFTAALSVVMTIILSVFWLIPGMNPDPTFTPVWSVVVALILSLIGIIYLKRWESRTPVENQFAIQPLPCMVLPNIEPNNENDASVKE